MQTLRRQEKMLSQCEALLKQVGPDDKKSSNYKEMQSVYDQYQRVFGKKGVNTQMQRDHIQEMIDEEGKKKFEENWMGVGEDRDRK